jgi:hypothetical protein
VTASGGARTRRGAVPRLRVDCASVPALLAGCIVVAALSLLLPSTPTYDPWAWIVWGREIVHLDLTTAFGPSWKPLPVIFTTVFAPLGDAAPALWLVVARAGALLALLLAFHVARRLAGEGLPGLLAGVVAAVGIVLGDGWVRNGLQGNSEGLLVALCLWAVERHLANAHRQAFALGFAAALLRPEVWPFLGLYALWLWLGERGARRLVASLLALVPALWFLPELWGSGDPLRASSRARTPDLGTAAYAERPALEVAETAYELLPAPIVVGFALGVAAALVGVARRRGGGAVLALAGAAVAWVAIVAAMTEAGYAGNPRYLVLAAALASVCAGVGWALPVRWIAARASRSGRPRLAAAAGPAAAAIVVLAALPSAVPRADEALAEADVARSQAELYDGLPDAVEHAGGRDQVLACGHPYTGKFQVPAVAWHLRVHVRDVGIHPELPAVVFWARGSPPLTSVSVPFEGFVASGEWRVLTACRTR